MPLVYMTVIKVTIVTGAGTDQIYMEVAMPDGFYPFDPKSTNVEMRVARGQGVNYLLEHFPQLKDMYTVVQRG